MAILQKKHNNRYTMKQKLVELYESLVASLDNKNTGFSGKKLTAFAIVVCVIIAHVKWIALGNFDQLEMVLGIDYGFIAVLFGINEYGKKTNPTEKEPS